MTKIDFNRIIYKIQDEIRLVSATLKDKGGNRFGRALLVALAVPCGCYFLVYKPAHGRVLLVNGQLLVARNAAKHAEAYKDLQYRLDLAYSQLPSPSDRTNFLSDAVKEALRADGIVPISFQPPNDIEGPGGVVQSLSITMRVKFPDLMAFLARMETHKPLIHVNSLELKKNTGQLGYNDVVCGVSTIILPGRF
jgi:hypothetical protein